VPTPANDDTKLLFRLLADGEWHLFKEIRETMAHKVAPGRAYRAYERDVAYRRKYKGDPNYDTRRTQEERIEFGQRKCVQAAISEWKDIGVEFRGENDAREIRIKKGFTSWVIPGFEPNQKSQDPGSEAEGYTDPPPEDSVRSAAQPGPGNEGSASEPPSSEREEGPVMQESKEDGSASGVPLAAEPTPTTDHDYAELRNEWLRDSFICHACGLLVTNSALHMQWHEALAQENTPENSGMLDESQLRHIVTDVMEQGLDQFQQGLQSYLDKQFAQVEVLLSGSRRPLNRWIARPESD
jgi:hypothetical protein